MSQEICIVNWNPKLVLEGSQIRSSICHHGKCRTPFGLLLNHFTMGLFSHLPVTSAISPESKTEKKKGSPIPPSHEVVWQGKLLAQDRVWWSIPPWLPTALSFSPDPFKPPVSSHRARKRHLSTVLGACKHPVHGGKGTDTGKSP